MPQLGVALALLHLEIAFVIVVVMVVVIIAVVIIIARAYVGRFFAHVSLIVFSHAVARVCLSACFLYLHICLRISPVWLSACFSLRLKGLS